MSLTKDLVYLAVLVLLLPLWIALGCLAAIVLGALRLYWWMQSKPTFTRMVTRWTRRTRDRPVTARSVTPSPSESASRA